jgi:hypothetical protein
MAKLKVQFMTKGRSRTSGSSGGPLIRQMREQKRKLKFQLENEKDPIKKAILAKRIDRMSRTIKKKMKISNRREKVLSIKYPNLDK